MQKIDYEVADFTTSLEKKISENMKNMSDMPKWYAVLLDIYQTLATKIAEYKDHQFMSFWKDHIHRMWHNYCPRFPEIIQKNSDSPKFVQTLEKLKITLDKLMLIVGYP